jgi:hypothetical protein
MSLTTMPKSTVPDVNRSLVTFSRGAQPAARNINAHPPMIRMIHLQSLMLSPVRLRFRDPATAGPPLIIGNLCPVATFLVILHSSPRSG